MYHRRVCMVKQKHLCRDTFREEKVGDLRGGVCALATPQPIVPTSHERDTSYILEKLKSELFFLRM